MAERQGFEPWIEFPLYTLSKRAPSATRPSLRFEDATQAHVHCNVCGDAQPALRLRSGQGRLRHACREASVFFFFQLLREVVLNPHLADGVQLAFQPINVMLFVDENFF